MMLIADRKIDTAMAEAALAQIGEAHDAMRAGGHGPNADYYKSQLPRAIALVERLNGR